MPEMRAETAREAHRKGIELEEDVSDPYELTAVSMPTGSLPSRHHDGKPHAITERAERLRTGRHLERGESGGS